MYKAAIAFVLVLISASFGAELFLPTPAPASKDSGQPNFFSSKSALYMSWLEGPQNSKALKFAKWNGNSWSQAQTIVSGVPFFVNWADFPSVLATDNGQLAAHWLQKSSA